MAMLPFASRSGFFGDGRTAEILFALSFTWVAIVGMACIGFFFMDAATFCARIADLIARTFFGSDPGLKVRFFSPRRCVPVTLFLISAVVCYSFFEAWNVRRTDLTLKTGKLSEGIERLRLVHLTDIHLGGVYSIGRLERVMDIVRSADPDILVMTGDLVDANMTGWDREAELIASVAAKAKYGAFAVTGNHEFYQGIDQALVFTERAGLTVIRDGLAQAAGITIVGLDDIAKYGWGMTESASLPEGVSFPADGFVLLLKHRPQIIDGTPGKFDLQLSGHTHGGQIWPFGYVARWINGVKQHLSLHGEHNESALYVSNGAGFWGPPLRFLTPPEVTVIDLVKE